MFFIHGGSFRTGYAGPSEMADYLVDEKVVLVAPQYRLGILGDCFFIYPPPHLTKGIL